MFEEIEQLNGLLTIYNLDSSVIKMSLVPEVPAKVFECTPVSTHPSS